MTESLCECLRQRGDVARRVALLTNFYDLPAPARQALDGLAALVENAAGEIARLQRDLLQAYLLNVYKPEGVDLWLADTKNKGQSLELQLQRAEQLVTGAVV